MSMDGSQHPVNSSVGVGGSATFQCTVRSDVLPHIQVRNARTRLERFLQQSLRRINSQTGSGAASMNKRNSIHLKVFRLRLLVVVKAD